MSTTDNELRNRSSSNSQSPPNQSGRSPSNRLNSVEEIFVHPLNLSNFNWRLALSPVLNLFNFNHNTPRTTVGHNNGPTQSTTGGQSESPFNSPTGNTPSEQHRRAPEQPPPLIPTANIINNDTLLAENLTETFDIHLNLDQNTIFISRPHLIRVIFFSITAFYVDFFPSKVRKSFEYGLLICAILSFLTLIYLHSLFIRSPINCLQNVHKTWNGEGILRVEILDEQEKMINFSLEKNESATKDLKEFEMFSKQVRPSNFYVVEYSLEHGFLRLSSEARSKLNISVMTVTLDPSKDSCFGDALSRFILKYFLGYNDILLNSLKGLAENQSSRGFIKNLVTGEYFRFTLTISMLIRYSHHQILILTMQICNMLQPNSTVNFPFASICTVILALIGIEAIMSEFFNDTQTALNVILIVWAADVFDWACCNTTITKRNWLKFFYLYHFAFYAYSYRFNGQYSNLALLSSFFFTAHSMIYFLHHYEIPYILSLFRVQI